MDDAMKSITQQIIRRMGGRLPLLRSLLVNAESVEFHRRTASHRIGSGKSYDHARQQRSAAYVRDEDDLASQRAKCLSGRG
jgi:hypothetical protein